jgi:membrane protease YdiL (CAAX protease family)
MQSLDDQNGWVVSANAARRHIPGSVALGIAILTFAITLSAAPAIIVFAKSLFGQDAHFSIGGIRLTVSLSYFVPLNATVGLLGYLWYERRPWPRAHLSWFPFGLLAGTIAFLMTLAVAYALGVVRFVSSSAISIPFLVGLTEAVLIIGLRTFGEEFFFRAWLQPLLARSWGVPAALAATSILFGLVHVASRGIPLVALINVTLAGAFFGLLAFRTGGLAAPFAAHWIWNALEQCMFGLTPNPGVDPMGTIIDLDLIGPTLLAGGPDGLNGSLGTTVILIVCVAALTFATRLTSWRQAEAEVP